MNVGDSVRVDGREAKILKKLAGGKHVRFILSDGREVLDLHKRDNVSVTTPAEVQLPIKELPQSGWEFEEGDDDEEAEEEASDTDN